MTARLVVAGGFDASGAQAPLVDVVVALHDLSRPVARTVRSVFARPGDEHPTEHAELDRGSGAGRATGAVSPATGRQTTSGTVDGRLRVTVACHELDAADVAALLPAELAPAVRLLEVRDGLGSPSGPYNAGVAAATAPYVAIIGSDDFFEPGALLAWHARAEASGAEMVLARMRMQGGAPVNTPRARPFRSARLDAVKDRMAYRTAPLGLLRRESLDDLGLRLDEGMKVGGDISFTVRLWDLAARVDVARTDPAYVVGVDAQTRVTTTVRPLAVSLAPYTSLLGRDWFPRLPRAYQRAVAIKVLRIHVLDNVARRSTVDLWSDGEADYLRDVVSSLVAVAPRVLRPFSAADRVVLDACLDPRSTPSSLVAASVARDRSGRLARLLPPGLLGALDRESTLRYYVADRFWR